MFRHFSCDLPVQILTFVGDIQNCERKIKHFGEGNVFINIILFSNKNGWSFCAPVNQESVLCNRLRVVALVTGTLQDVLL